MSETQLESNIIARLIWAGPEDAHTELLAELLRIPKLQAAFFECATGRTDVPMLSVETQADNVNAKGQPDARLEGPNWLVLLESKLNAPLTDNQPNEYVKELTLAEGTQMLIFVVPSKRELSIKAEIAVRLGLPRGELGLTIVEGVQVLVTTWMSVAAAFQSIAVEDEIGRFLRDSFCDLTPRSAEYASTPLGSEECKMLQDTTVLQSLVALGDCLTEARMQLRQRGYTVKLSTSSNFSNYGMNVTSQEGVRMWVGFFPAASLEHNKGPLWAQCGSSYDYLKLEEVGLELHDPSKYPGWGGRITPLKLKFQDDGTALEPRDLAMVIVGQLERMIEIGGPKKEN